MLLLCLLGAAFADRDPLGAGTKYRSARDAVAAAAGPQGRAAAAAPGAEATFWQRRWPAAPALHPDAPEGFDNWELPEALNQLDQFEADAESTTALAQETSSTTQTSPAVQEFAEKKLSQKKTMVGANFFGMVALVVFWFFLLFYMGAVGNDDTTETVDLKEKFLEYERRNNEELHRITAINWLTLRFEDPEQELRYIQVRGQLMNQRTLVLAMLLIVYNLMHVAVTKDNAGKWILMPVLRKFTQSPAAFVYLCAQGMSFAMSLVLLFCGLRWRSFSENRHLEKLVVTWACMQTMLIGGLGSQWFVARAFKEDPDVLFGNLDCFSEELPWQFLALYTTTIIPVRFFVCGPFCALLPILYSALIVRYGSPIQEARIASSEKHLGVFVLVFEAVSGLGFISAFALVGKYFNETQDRVSFVSRLNAFNTIQDLTAIEEVQGTAPIDKARAALNAATKQLEACIGGQSDKELIERAKGQVDFALGMMRNISKFFEVKAEDLLKGTGVEGNPEYVAFLTQDNEEVALRPATTNRQNNASNLLKQKVINARETGILKQLDDHVKMQNSGELVAGWGMDWTFSALPAARATGSCALLFAAEHAFVATGATEVLGVDETCVRSWVREIHSRYTAAAYHNEAHAAQVAHFSYWFAKQIGLLERAEPAMIVALLLASIAHDVGHPGKNALFLTKTAHPISVIWNDQSVLENMHSALCFTIMRGKSAILDKLDHATKMSVRIAIMRFILATDIKEHGPSMAKLKAMMDDPEFLAKLDDEGKDSHEEVLIAGEFILRTSDIAHCMLPWEHHKEWSYRVQVEFFEQGDMEKQLKVPVSPLCERGNCNIAGGQGFFIDHFGVGLLTVLLDFNQRIVRDQKSAGKDALQNCLKHGRENKEKWKEETFDAMTLSLQKVEQIWGRPQATLVYPYAFKSEAVLRHRTCEQNLEELAGPPETPPV